MSITRPIYKFQRGEPIVVGWEVLSGDPAGYAVTALLKPSRGQTAAPPANVAAVAQFEVEFEAAEGERKARWLLSIPGSVTAGLEPGHYAFDAVFSLAGAVVQITDPAFITLTPSVSG